MLRNVCWPQKCNSLVIKTHFNFLTSWTKTNFFLVFGLPEGKKKKKVMSEKKASFGAENLTHNIEKYRIILHNFEGPLVTRSSRNKNKNNCRGSIPLWVLPYAYTIFYFHPRAVTPHNFYPITLLFKNLDE